MMDHLDDTTLHDLLDGELPEERATEARRHLDGCLPCARRHRSLRATLEALADLPSGAETPARVWEAVRRRTVGAAAAAPGPAPGGVRPAGGDPAARSRARRFSLVELATAAALVGLLSAGTVWMALSPGSGPLGPDFGADPPVSSTGLQSPGGPVAGAAARAVATGGEEYDDVVRELEALVAAGRSVLEPQTLRTLERATASVDRALAEIRAALEEDPGSALLERLRVTQQTRKLRILRQAVTAIESRT